MRTPRPLRLRRPSPALVVASIALLVALGGTSYAAVALPKGSVGTVQLRTGAVTSSKVRNGSLQAVDLAPVARLALRGAAGPQGPAGPKGDKGDRGPAGALGIELVGETTGYSSISPKTMTVACPGGKRLVGGGAAAWGRALRFVPDNVALTASHPADDRTWVAAAHELVPTEETWTLRVDALCVPAS